MANEGSEGVAYIQIHYDTAVIHTIARVKFFQIKYSRFDSKLRRRSLSVWWTNRVQSVCWIFNRENASTEVRDAMRKLVENPKSVIRYSVHDGKSDAGEYAVRYVYRECCFEMRSRLTIRNQCCRSFNPEK